jgi:large subunit ribosomal protein L21
MYAILQQSGHQYRVSPGDRLVVDRLVAEVGSVVALEPVVLVANDDGTQIGSPVVDGVRVAAVVVSHRKGAKIRVFKYKAKKHYRRTQGHRSALTELRVEAVLAAGEPLPKPKAAEKPVPKAAAPAAEKPARSRARAKAPEAEAPAATEAPEAAEAPEAGGGAEAPAEETPKPRASRARAAKAEAAETAGTADADATAEKAPDEAPRKRTPRKKPDTTPES